MCLAGGSITKLPPSDDVHRFVVAVNEPEIDGAGGRHYILNLGSSSAEHKRWIEVSSPSVASETWPGQLASGEGGFESHRCWRNVSCHAGNETWPRGWSNRRAR